MYTHINKNATGLLLSVRSPPYHAGPKFIPPPSPPSGALRLFFARRLLLLLDTHTTTTVSLYKAALHKVFLCDRRRQHAFGFHNAYLHINCWILTRTFPFCRRLFRHVRRRKVLSRKTKTHSAARQLRNCTRILTVRPSPHHQKKKRRGNDFFNWNTYTLVLTLVLLSYFKSQSDFDMPAYTIHRCHGRFKYTYIIHVRKNLL